MTGIGSANSHSGVRPTTHLCRLFVVWSQSGPTAWPGRSWSEETCAGAVYRPHLAYAPDSSRGVPVRVGGGGAAGVRYTHQQRLLVFCWTAAENPVAGDASVIRPGPAQDDVVVLHHPRRVGPRGRRVGCGQYAAPHGLAASRLSVNLSSLSLWGMQSSPAGVWRRRRTVLPGRLQPRCHWCRCLRRGVPA